MQPRKTPERWYDPCLELDLRLLTMEGFLHHNHPEFDYPLGTFISSRVLWSSLFLLISFSTTTALEIHGQDVSNTLASTGPVIMLKNRVVANVLRGSEEVKSYLTSVLLESRKNVT
jgi:hypothetical protein